MKNRIYKTLVILSVIVTSMLGSSCTRRVLDAPYTECKIKIVFDWKHVPVGDPVPSKMNICLYNSDGTFVTKECSATLGYNGDIPIGTYRIIAYSADAPNIEFQDLGTYEGAKAVVSELPGMSYLSQPKDFYVATSQNVSALAVDNGTLTMIPDLLSKKAELKMVITGNKSLIASSVVTLNGISKAIKMGTNELKDGSGTISVIPTTNSTGFGSVFSLFGKDVSTQNFINVHFNFNDGSQQKMDPIDISTSMSDINKFSNSYVVVTVVLNIEIVGSEQAGFTAKLKNWYPDYRDVTVL